MRDQACVEFLQWCLPRMGLRWPGYRKVRGTVCKRIRGRMRELDLSGPDAYRDYLSADAGEWQRLDGFCRIPISRFYRDRGVFAAIGRTVLPELAARAVARGVATIRCWSAGCASGEEPYTVSILWQCHAEGAPHQARIEIVATDADPVMLRRAKEGCYAEGSLREVPDTLRHRAFDRRNAAICVRSAFKEPVRFAQQDIRQEMPSGPFDLILCRNLILTYFDSAGQRAIFQRLLSRLPAGGYLVVGAHERLPAGFETAFAALDALPIYRRLPAAPSAQTPAEPPAICG